MSDPDLPFFTRDGAFCVGADPARGPWSADHCHAGPVAGLIARALEQVAGPEKPIARLTIDLMRPAPMAGLRVEARLERQGRRAATASARLLDRDGVVCAAATSLHMALGDIGAPPTAPFAPPKLAEARPGRFPVTAGLHDRPFFTDFAEIRTPPDQTLEPGPTTLWMRARPLLADETPSPFQRLCPLADCGNAIARNAEIDAYGFVNADLSIHAHRQSAADWLATQAVCFWQPSGVGLSQAVLMDEEGPIATALQTLSLTRAGA